MVWANRRARIAFLAFIVIALPIFSSLAAVAATDCSDVGPTQVGDCPAPNSTPQAQGSTAQPADARGAAARFYSLVNGERSNRGLRRLVRNAQLERIALGHAKHMAEAGKIYHNDALFSASTVAALGNPTELGENVGRGGSVDDLHASFMASKAHRVNVLDGSYAEAGIAVVYGSGQLWVVETFMSPVAHRKAARVWAGGGSDDIVRAPVLRFSGPPIASWRWAAPAVQEQEVFSAPVVATNPEVLGIRESLKSVPAGATGIAFAIAFAAVLGGALQSRKTEEEYL